nr:MAG TPA: Flagellar assembly protein T, C-terminal domain [Caudoviricetes sp.]
MKQEHKDYKVIDIINKFNIIINYGSNDGAFEGQEVRISTIGDEIFDLDGKSLGNIEIIKDELEITRVYENFSICKKIVVSELNPFQPIPIIKKQKKALELNVDEKDFSNIKYQDKSPIKKGDSIKILN